MSSSTARPRCVTYIKLSPETEVWQDDIRRGMLVLFGTQFELAESIDYPGYLEIWAPRQVVPDDFEQFYRGDIGQVETVYGGSSEGGQDTGPSEPPDPWKKKKKHKSNEWDKPDNKNHGHHRSRDKHHDHHRKHRHRSDDDYDDHHHHRRHRHRPCSIL